MKITRRTAISHLPGLVAAASIPSPAQSAQLAGQTLRADVCIIGAGFAGLSAAYRLKKAGLNVVVMEARNRVGGRSLSGELKGGGWVDLGAQWAGPTQAGQSHFKTGSEVLTGMRHPTLLF